MVALARCASELAVQVAISVSESPQEDQPIVNLYSARPVEMLPGIQGRSGVAGLPLGLAIQGHLGIDLIEMEPGTSFPLHTHPGAHILFVLEGEGTVTIGNRTYPTQPGDCYFVPGDTSHAVSASQRHRLLAIGFPHRALTDPERMTVQE